MGLRVARMISLQEPLKGTKKDKWGEKDKWEREVSPVQALPCLHTFSAKPNEKVSKSNGWQGEDLGKVTKITTQKITTPGTRVVIY